MDLADQIFSFYDCAQPIDFGRETELQQKLMH